MSKVKEVHEVLTKLIENGYGDYDLVQGYDCDYGHTKVNVNNLVFMDKKDQLIYFQDDYTLTKRARNERLSNYEEADLW